MGWLDLVPRAGGLYIGGLYSLRRRDAVKEAGLTHVVSVIRFKIDPDLVGPFKHLQIEVDDDEEENLLEHFPTTNKFIEDALDAGGRVLVHCAMGKSRSATIVIAYLMSKYKITPDEALAQVREARAVCEPNDGFWDQLKRYHDMGTPVDLQSHRDFHRWLFSRELAAGRSVRQAPEADRIRFEDEQTDAVEAAPAADGLELKCRKCRRTLATSQFFAEHKPIQVAGRLPSEPIPAWACAHYFVEPLSWMRPILEKGELEGRLECPKCSSNVGKYAWQGSACSCSGWVMPGISLNKARVDEVRTGLNASSQASLGIRHPPGRGPGKESL